MSKRKPGHISVRLNQRTQQELERIEKVLRDDPNLGPMLRAQTGGAQGQIVRWCISRAHASLQGREG